MKQIANVAALPGIVGRSIALPDVHAGYGFAIGNVAAFDMGKACTLCTVAIARLTIVHTESARLRAFETLALMRFGATTRKS